MQHFYENNETNIMDPEYQQQLEQALQQLNISSLEDGIEQLEAHREKIEDIRSKYEVVQTMQDMQAEMIEIKNVQESDQNLTPEIIQ